jgi:hypothetical protein
MILFVHSMTPAADTKEDSFMAPRVMAVCLSLKRVVSNRMIFSIAP